MRTRTRTRDGQRGFISVELALVAPVLVLIVLGMLEMGLAWRDAITLTQSTRQAARVGSSLADDAQADRQALINLMSVLDPDLSGDIISVVVYEGSGNGEVPSQCKTNSRNNASAKCNRYTPADLAQLTDNSKWGCGAGTHDRVWCPTSRSRTIGNPDHLGVWVKVDHQWGSNLFPGSITIDKHTVMRLEPDNS